MTCNSASGPWAKWEHGPRDSDLVPFLVGLSGTEPEEALGRIFDGDPLGLQGRVMRILRGNGFLLDPDRCMQSSLEEIAFQVSGSTRNEAQHFDAHWIDQSIEQACDRLFAEDAEDERLWGLGVRVEDCSHHYLSEAFGVTWGDGRSASVAFHRLGLRSRLSFFAVCIDQVPTQEWLDQTGGQNGELRRDLWDVFQALGYVSEYEVSEFRARG